MVESRMLKLLRNSFVVSGLLFSTALATPVGGQDELADNTFSVVYLPPEVREKIYEKLGEDLARKAKNGTLNFRSSDFKKVQQLRLIERCANEILHPFFTHTIRSVDDIVSDTFNDVVRSPYVVVLEMPERPFFDVSGEHEPFGKFYQAQQILLKNLKKKIF